MNYCYIIHISQIITFLLIKEEEEKNYREWLRGQKAHLNNEEVNELKPLKDFWSNPKLDENEAFLRDYVLNQRLELFSMRIHLYFHIS